MELAGAKAQTGGASAAVTRGDIWRLWCSMAKARMEGVFFKGTKAKERMIKCEADSHGVGIRGSGREPGNKLPRTAPLPDKAECVGDLTKIIRFHQILLGSAIDGPQGRGCCLVQPCASATSSPDGLVRL